MKNLIGSLILPFLLLGLVGCAQKRKVEKEVTEEVSQQKIDTPSELRREVADTIRKTPGLTEDQRARLMELREKMEGQLANLSKESTRLKATLLEEVVSPEDNRTKVSSLKKRMKKNEEKKLAILFDSIDRADRILGKNRDRSLIMGQMFNDGVSFDHLQRQ